MGQNLEGTGPTPDHHRKVRVVEGGGLGRRSEKGGPHPGPGEEDTKDERSEGHNRKTPLGELFVPVRGTEEGGYGT